MAPSASTTLLQTSCSRPIRRARCRRFLTHCSATQLIWCDSTCSREDGCSRCEHTHASNSTLVHPRHCTARLLSTSCVISGAMSGLLHSVILLWAAGSPRSLRLRGSPARPSCARCVSLTRRSCTVWLSSTGCPIDVVLASPCDACAASTHVPRAHADQRTFLSLVREISMSTTVCVPLEITSTHYTKQLASSWRKLRLRVGYMCTQARESMHTCKTGTVLTMF